MRIWCVACLACLAGAALSAERVVTIDERQILVGPAYPAEPLVEVGGVRVYTCRTVIGSKPCTVITGKVIAHLAHQGFDVHLTFQLRGRGGSHLGQPTVTMKTIIRRPMPDKPTPFTCLGPPCFTPAPDGKVKATAQGRYSVVADVVKAGPRRMDEDW